MVHRTWMMSQSSEPLLSSSEALLQKRYSQAKELENQLFALLSARGPLDPHVQHLNNNIRDCYEGIILSDHAFAESHDVEQAIWNLHYKQIEDFRHRINHIKSMGQGTGAQVSSRTVFSRGRRKNFLQREPVMAVFKSFLAEASGFYHELISKLRAKYGLPFDISERDPIIDYDDKKTVELKRCQRSCHRCLVYLGDFARYKEFHVGCGARNFNFSIAADFYRKAVSLWPSVGQPHNQMAVLAVYMGDDLLAVYHYFRSLAAEKPFPTARENLTMLFETNRLKYCQLPAVVETKERTTKLEYLKVAEVKSVGGRAPKLSKRNGIQEASHELENKFHVCFVRLNGILFTKTSLEVFEDVCSAVVFDLEKLLTLDDTKLEERLGSGHGISMGTGNRGAAGALQLVTILICSVENVNWGSSGNQPTYADGLQRAVLFKYAITASVEIVGLIICRCAETNDVFSCPLLPAVLVFLEWLACRPEVALGAKAGEKQANTWLRFWKHCVTLLNQFCDNDSLNCVLTDKLEASVGISVLEDCKMDIPLWEDSELQGFFPLAPAHLALDYSKRKSGNGMGIKKEGPIRLQRFLAAGKAIVNALDESGIGILFDDNVGKFYCVGETLRKGSAVNGGLNTEVCSSTDKSLRNADKASKERAVTVNFLPSKQAFGDDEDEEVIVFKPFMHTQAFLTACKSVDDVSEPSLCSNALLDPPAVNSTPSFKVDDVLVSLIPTLQDRVSLVDGLGNLCSGSNPATCSVLNVGKDTSGMKMAYPLSALSTPNAFSLGEGSYSTSSLNVPTISNLLKGVDLITTSLLYSPMSTTLPAPQDQVNQTGMPCIGSIDGTASSTMGSVGMLPDYLKKASNTAGVIGQPRQIHNVMLETIDKCSVQCLANPYKKTTRGLTDVRDHHAALTLLSGVSSVSNVQAVPACDNPSEKVHNNFNVSPKLVTSTAGLSSPSKESHSSASAVMRPPPGFAPQPINSSRNFLESGDGAKDQMRNQKSWNDQQEFDDYCWLDDYKPSNLAPSHGEKNLVPAGYSADYSLWSSGISSWVKPNMEAFPFPMMKSSRFHTKEEQKQQSAKESWSLFGAAVPSHWNSTISS